MTPPHDLDLERELLGSLLLFPHALDDVLAVTGPDDCYSPAHAAAFAAIVALQRRGDDPTDLRLVLAEVGTQGFTVDPADAVVWQAHGSVKWRTAAARLAELRLRRDLQVLGAFAAEAATVGDPVAAVEELRLRVEGLNTATSDVPDSLLVAADVADQRFEPPPWVVPGMLRRGWRSMVVAFEGAGKSVLLSQVAWCASQGLHPFLRKPIPPVVALHVDLENTLDRVSDGYRPLAELCRAQSPDFDRTRTWVWHRPDGIDVRSRRDAAELEAILRQLRPDLVCIGPLRKAYRRRPNENDESSSLDVQWHLDQLRARYGFALLIEHHAPHADGGFGGRKARPFGSSTWLGWPEFGIGMTEHKDRKGDYVLDRWRGDRVRAEWPDELHRGASWPWDGWRQTGWGSWQVPEGTLPPLQEAV